MLALGDWALSLWVPPNVKDPFQTPSPRLLHAFVSQIRSRHGVKLLGANANPGCLRPELCSLSGHTAVSVGSSGDSPAPAALGRPHLTVGSSRLSYSNCSVCGRNHRYVKVPQSAG